MATPVHVATEMCERRVRRLNHVDLGVGLTVEVGGETGGLNAVLVLVEVFGVDGCDAGGVGVTGVGAGDMLICWPGVVAVVAVVAAVLMGT